VVGTNVNGADVSVGAVVGIIVGTSVSVGAKTGKLFERLRVGAKLASPLSLLPLLVVPLPFPSVPFPL